VHCHPDPSPDPGPDPGPNSVPKPGPTAQAPNQAPTLRSLDELKMGDDLGAGASGTVKKATHMPSGHFVAVKQIQACRTNPNPNPGPSPSPSPSPSPNPEPDH
jgi:hypothetical protein